MLRRKRGQILSVEPRVGTPIVVVKSHLPVSEAFHLTDQLRAASSGRAFPQCVRTSPVMHDFYHFVSRY